MSFRLLLILLITVLFSAACTSSRWVVTDEHVIDSSIEPEIINERSVLLLQDEPVPDNPVISFSVYQIQEKEYQQRVQIERTVQRYRPKWLFLLLGLGGAAFSVLAANTDVFVPNASSEQQLSLNLTALLLSGLALSNMEPSGEPIFTGESEMMRRSGTEIINDTLRTDDAEFDLTVNLDVTFHDETLFSETDLPITNGRLNINLLNVTEGLESGMISPESVVHLALTYGDNSSEYEVPITSFLAPYVTVTSPVAVLRNSASIQEMNIITEVGIGSSLELVDEEMEEWYRVRFGGSEVFLSRNAGEIEWMSEAVSGTPDVFEYAEVPFGEIDVENSVPILKSRNPGDRAIVLTNGFLEDEEPRQYLDRDHQLFRFYMRYALQMQENQIHTIEMDSTDEWKRELQNIAPADTSGSLFVYLSGFAVVQDQMNLRLVGVDEPGSEELPLLTTFVFDEMERINPNALFLMADLDFVENTGYRAEAISRSAQTQALQFAANSLLRRIPNSVVVFSNRPGQKSSLYAGEGTVNMRHHIFNYYWAEAIQQRNRTMADIIRHLENNVDYTSRRLHDRPQEIQAFGNFTLSISE